MANSINMDPFLEIIGRLDVIEDKVKTIESANLGREVMLSDRAKILKIYHNKHLSQLMAINIDLNRFGGMKDDEVIGQEPLVGLPQAQGHVTMRKVTVKQRREQYNKMRENQLRTLRSIEELLEAEGVKLTPDVIAK